MRETVRNELTILAVSFCLKNICIDTVYYMAYNMNIKKYMKGDSI